MARGTISDIKRALQALPLSVAHSVAKRAAPALSDLTIEAFDSGRNVYGDSRPRGKRGPLTLVKTGETRRTLQFVANGTIVRCVLGTKYAKYLIGKYGVLPNGALPVDWVRALGAIVKETKGPDAV